MMFADPFRSRRMCAGLSHAGRRAPSGVSCIMCDAPKPCTDASWPGDHRMSAPALRALDGGRRHDASGPAVVELAAAVARALDDPAFAASVAHHRKLPVTVLSEPLMDAADVAALLKIPAKTVRQYAREGRLPSRQLGRHIRFVRAEVAVAIERGDLG
jgi:excisionase family DNA binding protein